MKRANRSAAPRMSAVLLAWILALLSFAACTGIVLRTGYRNADRLILLDLEKYFDLSSSQRDETRRMLQTQLNWHRHTELPRYATGLADLKSRLRRGLKPADVTWLYAMARSARTELMRHAEPDMASFLLSISPQQTAHLARHLEEFNKDLVKATTDSPEARLKKREEDLNDTARDWIGTLTPEQRGIIHAAAARMPDFPPVQLRYRRQRQKEFLSLMNERPDRKRILDQLDAWFGQPEPAYPPEYAKATQEWNAGMQALILSLESTLSSEQREHAIAHIDSFLSDIRQLTAN